MADHASEGSDDPPEKVEDQREVEPHVVNEEILDKFKRVYYSHSGGKYNLEVQVTYLIKLADGYFDKFKRTRHWKDALKAHALYNSVGFRCDDDPMWREKAFQVQKEYWEGTVQMDECESHRLTLVLSEKLKSIRETTDKQLNSPKLPLKKILDKLQSGKRNLLKAEKSFFNEMCKISTECTDRMIDVCKFLFEQSLAALLKTQKLPCSFCVVGIGSMAKGEATPYSDLEYIFLIEDENEETTRFFHLLAMTGYFFIGNLRETRLETMAITELETWFDDKQKCGFHIDGLEKKAGNIPTGNGLTDTTFILTPEALVKKYKTLLANPDETIRGDLTAMLQYTTLLFSSDPKGKKLLDRFMTERNSCPTTLQRQNSNQQVFEEDAKWYNFKPSYELIDNGYQVNAKKELYRYPSILLNNIAIVAGFHDMNSWKTLLGLYEREVLSESVFQAISFLLAVTCYFRLAAYLFHDSHDDRLSALGNTRNLGIHQSNRNLVSSKAGKRWFIPQALFAKHCEVAIPLKSHIAQCVSVPIVELLLQEIQEPTWLIRFQIQHYCHKWLGAWNLFEEKIGLNVYEKDPHDIMNKIRSEVCGDTQNLWFCIKALTYLFFQQRKYETADNFLKSFLLEINGLLESDSKGFIDVDVLKLIKADVLEELGTGHVYLDRHSEGEKFYRKSLEIRLEFMSTKPNLVAKTQLYLGRCIRLMFRFTEAEKILVEAMQTFHSLASHEPRYDYYGEEIPPTEIAYQLENAQSPDLVMRFLNNSSVMLGRVIWNLGNIYFYRKYYHRALNYFEAARRMHNEAYGDHACHKDIGECLITLAMVSDSLGHHEKAERYYRDSVLVTVQLFKPNAVRFIQLSESVSNNRLGAHVYYSQVMNIFQTMPGYKVKHVESARIAQMFGTHLIHMKHHKLAEWVLGEFVINMYMQTDRYRPRDIEIARNVTLIAINDWKQGDIQQASVLFISALEMMNALESSEYVDLEAAELLQTMGQMYLEQRDFPNARKYLQLSHERYSRRCQAFHPKLLETEQQLRSADDSY